MSEHTNIRSLLQKPRYNVEELKKAVDINVDELVPPEKRRRLDLVPRERFDAVVTTNEELNDELSATREQITNLENEISDLENQVDQAEITTDEAQLARSVAENRATALQDQFQQLNLDFREALQKSIQEGINKLSLQAQNDGLRAEVNALRTDLAILQATSERLEERLEGRESDLQRGADLLGTDVTVLNLQPPTNPNSTPIRLFYRRFAPLTEATFTQGKTWRVRNFGENRVEIRVEHTEIGTKGIVEPENPTFALDPGEERVFDFRIDPGVVWSASTGGFFNNVGEFVGRMVFTLLSTGESISFETKFRKES